MEKLKSEILLKQIKIVNENLKLTIVSSAIMLLVIGYQLYQEFQYLTVIIWFFISGFSLIFRSYLFLIQKTFPLNSKNLQTWYKLIIINTVLTGITYGFASISTHFMLDEVHIMIMYILLAGVSAGAVTAYGSVKNISTIFILPIIVPLIIINLWVSQTDRYILAIILTLFVYIVLSTSKNAYQTFLNTIKQDVTIRTLNEEKVKMSDMEKLKSDFFASMSHEIRTPLNGIIGLVDLLQNNMIAKDLQKDYLETIKKSSDDLLNVINDVLDLSKIESGKMVLLPKNTNISSFINRMTMLFSEKAKAKGIKLKMHLDPEVPNLVFIDEHRLSQIITNMISNAIKFTTEGEVQLSVNILNKTKKSVKLQFNVEDTGIGIPQDMQKLVFNKYDQIANPNNYLVTQEGTGLGLSIAKKIVLLMGGEIGVFNNEQKGSTFWFILDIPLARTKHSLKPKSNNKIKFNLNVLLVDDKEINLKVADLMLTSLGCNVDCALNGEAAIQLYDKSPDKYNLIIMDIQMPVMDGITATRKLREKHSIKLPPIYGLSAQLMKNLQKSPEELGFDYYLTKPLSLDALTNSLTRLKEIK